MKYFGIIRFCLAKIFESSNFWHQIHFKKILQVQNFAKYLQNFAIHVDYSKQITFKFGCLFFCHDIYSQQGKQKQTSRTTTFFQFCNATSGILLCTDVAARGLDIPDVDWIVQYDPPDDPKEYIHRVGRTARGEGSSGHALLILRPEELGFLRYLKQARVPVNEFDFTWNKIADIQLQVS